LPSCSLATSLLPIPTPANAEHLIGEPKVQMLVRKVKGGEGKRQHSQLKSECRPAEDISTQNDEQKLAVTQNRWNQSRKRAQSLIQWASK